MRSVIFYILSLPFIQSGQDFRIKVVNATDRKEPVKSDISIPVLVGGVARLPCNITPPEPGVNLKVVLWLDREQTFYVHDRRKNLANENDWKNNTIPKASRATFYTGSSPAILEIRDVQEDDATEFRCRVDFDGDTLTRNQFVTLKVIVPPGRPTIIDGATNRPANSRIGPYRIGDNVTLTCLVIGGNPLPDIQWQMDNAEVLNTSVVRASDMTSSRSIMHLIDIDRSHLDTILTCKTFIGNIINVTSTVSLDMIFEPVSVEIEEKSRIFEEGKTLKFSCVVTGARPEPRITWTLGNETLVGNLHRDPHNWNKNVSISEVSLTATMDRTGLPLICSASTPGIDATKRDSVILNIKYKPQVYLQLSNHLNASSISEGMDVFFECKIRSNPIVKSPVWKLNNVVIEEDKDRGIILPGKNLVIQNITKDWQGVYTCQGKNEVGKGKSLPLKLDVRHTPVCVREQKFRYEALRGEEITVSCAVHANPIHKIRYYWKFNNTSKSYDFEEKDITSARNTSTIRFKPRNDMDYGALECWAENNIGRQKQPCVFSVVRGGPPASPKECAIQNVTYSGFNILCGDKRGLTFHLECRESITGHLVMEANTKNAEFVLNELLPGTPYNCFIAVSNTDGEKSNKISLLTTTLREPEKQIAETRIRGESNITVADTSSLSTIIAIIIGALVTLIIIVMAVVSVVCSKNKRRNPRSNSESADESVNQSACEERLMSAENCNTREIPNDGKLNVLKDGSYANSQSSDNSYIHNTSTDTNNTSSQQFLGVDETSYTMNQHYRLSAHTKYSAATTSGHPSNNPVDNPPTALGNLTAAVGGYTLPNRKKKSSFNSGQQQLTAPGGGVPGQGDNSYYSSTMQRVGKLSPGEVMGQRMQNSSSYTPEMSDSGSYQPPPAAFSASARHEPASARHKPPYEPSPYITRASSSQQQSSNRETKIY